MYERKEDRSSADRSPMITGGSNNTSMIEAVQNDPQLRDYITDLVNRQVNQKMAQMGQQRSLGNSGCDQSQTTPKRPGNIGGHTNNCNTNTDRIKSPSDTTIYVPALCKGPREINTIVDRISDFVESVCIRTRKPSTDDDQDRYRSRQRSRSPARSSSSRRRSRTCERSVDSKGCHSRSRDKSKPREQYEDEMKEADDLTDHIILEAEKFKADVVAPKGKQIDKDQFDVITPELNLRRLFDNNDDFFHVTCHLDEGLKNKIKQGEFVDLEKLLPKEKGGRRVYSEEVRYQLMSKDGEPYFGPVQNENKVNGIRRWDQAFRIYAAVHTEAHPHRASELWQYVFTIHTVAHNHPWDSVYYYDVIFRQLMASKPWRSWGKAYNQGWNLALGGNTEASSSGYRKADVEQVNPGKSRSHDWRDDCCWRYNKNLCKKPGKDCRFDHRCTYCSGWNHSRSNCCKRSRKEGGNAGTTPQRHRDQVGRSGQDANKKNNSLAS